MAWVVEHQGWRPIVLLVPAAAAIVLPIVALLAAEQPLRSGCGAWGKTPMRRRCGRCRHRQSYRHRLRRAAQSREARRLLAVVRHFFICRRLGY